VDLLDFVVRTGSAFGLGLIIGVERQFGQHPAGLRTNALVSFGASLFVCLGWILTPQDEVATARIAAMVVSGIGFLGGGVILREGLTVRGMNTAATLWCTAAVGTICGAGQPGPGMLAAGGVLLLNLGMRPLAVFIDNRMRRAVNVETAYRVRVVCRQEREGKVRAVLMRQVNDSPGLHLNGLAIQPAEQANQVTLVADVFSHQRSDTTLDDLLSRLTTEQGVVSLGWENTR
jgi:putative Mg2+ transporter-C (MgtC) family protein